MAKLLPKRMLDIELLEEAARFYNLKVSKFKASDYVDWECFSHPSLELHECNSRAKLPGRHACKCCDNVVGKPCDISCDFQQFCLAVYAWRAGIGGADFRTALNNNLYVLDKEALYKEVTSKIAVEELDECDDCKPAKKATNKETNMQSNDEMVCTESVCCDACACEGCACKAEEASPDLLTVSQAALYCGCTYANIYNHIKHGTIPAVADPNGKKFRVMRADLDVFKNTERKRGRKPKAKTVVEGE